MLEEYHPCKCQNRRPTFSNFLLKVNYRRECRNRRPTLRRLSRSQRTRMAGQLAKLKKYKFDAVHDSLCTPLAIKYCLANYSLQRKFIIATAVQLARKSADLCLPLHGYTRPCYRDSRCAKVFPDGVRCTKLRSIVEKPGDGSQN